MILSESPAVSSKRLGSGRVTAIEVKPARDAKKKM